MSADFTFDKNAFDKFNHFMTDALEIELKRAYARTFRLLGAGAVRHVNRSLKGRQEHKEMLEAGIDFAPKKAARIQQLDPMRLAIGVNDLHQKRRDKKKLTSPVGKPFVVHRLDNPYTNGVQHVTAVLQRFGAPREVPWSRYPRQRLNLIALGESKIRSYTTFKYMVCEFISGNHDKIFEKQYHAAVERAAR